MTQEIKKFDNLLGLSGFSDTLLKNHFTLYEGYVKNVNSLLDLFKTLKAGSPEYNEIHRRFGWEWNGVVFHELYFANFTKDTNTLNTEGNLYKKITEGFGSYENWLENFKTLGLTRGIGWVALVEDKNSGALINIWIGEHDIGLLAQTNILLIMDVWEHSYVTDYGIKRIDYIDNFIKVINWSIVESRLINK
jgi:superoxide dismutase, Fe-Mn family